MLRNETHAKTRDEFVKKKRICITQTSYMKKTIKTLQQEHSETLYNYNKVDRCHL